MPKGAKAARSVAGNTIPMVLVTTADGEKSIQGISYDLLKSDMRDARRNLEKKLKTVDVAGSSAESEEPPAEAEATSTTEKSGLLAESQIWTNTDGKTITAAVKSVDGTNVVFVMSGREVPYQIAKLSEESRSRIEALRKP
ncbi:MAG: hypothetical protein MI807_17705 [Verrucomicrobiales bacterium]|nr:hypothetical protein [Verrucomicrobiales bacterium]